MRVEAVMGHDSGRGQDDAVRVEYGFAVKERTMGVVTASSSLNIEPESQM